ncbi:F-box/kelch-repeat protein [Spatholobus suberectus]|nr:F-box/kelch-repeat protein [Spatholobus suberectus]
MGNILNLNNSKTRWNDPYEVLQGEACKRQRLSSNSCEGSARLIPSLPDEISMQILARVPRIYYLNLKLVSRAWKATLVSSELFCVRKELGTMEEWLYILTKVKDDKLLWYALDPLSRRWQRLPPMPKVGFEDETKKGDIPIHDFTDSESPYLLAGLLGKLHVITKDANHNIAVLQADMQNEHAESAFSQSILPSPDNSFSEDAESSAETHGEFWKVLATRSGRSAELVNCQSLKI